jgi:small basic protein
MNRQRLASLFRHIPLFGPLVDCSFRDHVTSLGQTFVTVLLSTAPLWLGTLVIFGVRVNGDITLRAAFDSTISHGELFMYGTALLASVFWIALVDPPGARAFPSKMPHMLIIAVLDCIASVFFGLTVAGDHLREPFVFRLSVGVFWTALGLLYLGTVYHTSRLPDPSDVLKQQEVAFSEAYSEHRP